MITLKDVFELGINTQYLRICDVSLPRVKGDSYLLDALKGTIELVKNTKLCEERIELLETTMMALNKYNEDEKIKKEDADKLVKNMDYLISHLFKELSQRNIIEIGIKSGLDANELIKLSKKEQSEYFLKEKWDRLTDIEKSDISDAAKCLLLDSATPSVMVCLRGGEASIRNYYKAITKNDPGNKTWRQITHELKKDESKYRISATFISYLDYLGDAKRNLAQHPNKIFTIREAAVIFMQIIAMIDDIYNQI